MTDYARILKDFNRYDKSDRSIARTERLSNYLNEQILIFEALRDMLNDNIAIGNASKTALNDYEIKSLHASISYFIKKGATS